ncbi:hypothetical protein [Vibrio sp.]|uniref:hypothetical protein n=1 Tax=Vibrio sp. TaxID=678 RepID=UPI003D0A7083
MEIQVQSVQLGQRTEKEVLTLMRAAVKARYEYVLTLHETLIRFSSQIEGIVKQQVVLEKILAEYQGELESSNWFILLEHHSDTCEIISIKQGIIRSIDVVLHENLSKENLTGKAVFAADTLVDLIADWEPQPIPAIDDAEFAHSKHRLTEKYDPKLKQKLQGAVLMSLVGVLGWMLYPESEPEHVVVQEVKPKVVQERKIRMDRYYDYKAALVNRIEYSEVYPAIMAATLMSAKLPQGWEIEKVTASNDAVQAEILNNGGRTKTLKQFREFDSYREFLNIEGQFGLFSFPVTPSQWFKWTAQTLDFTNVRDDFMDEMLILGGRVKSNQPEYHEMFTTQQLNASFESVSMVYLDLLNQSFSNKPIFIDSMVVKPLPIIAPQNVSIELTVTVVGR